MDKSVKKHVLKKNIGKRVNSFLSHLIRIDYMQYLLFMKVFFCKEILYFLYGFLIRHANVCESQKNISTLSKNLTEQIGLAQGIFLSGFILLRENQLKCKYLQDDICHLILNKNKNHQK